MAENQPSELTRVIDEKQAAQTNAPIQACPVCYGRGHMPAGFFTGLPITSTERCRPCNGGGLLWTASGRPVREIDPLMEIADEMFPRSPATDTPKGKVVTIQPRRGVDAERVMGWLSRNFQGVGWVDDPEAVGLMVEIWGGNPLVNATLAREER